MKKIGDVTSTADKNGEWTNGNVAAGIVPTILDAAWLNSVQREILGVIIAAGLQQDKNDDTQLSKAIKKIISGGNYATAEDLKKYLAKDQNGADIQNKSKFIENLGLPEKFQPKGDYQPVGNYADKSSSVLQEFKGGVRAPYIDAITGEDRTGFRMINKKAIIYSVVDGKVYQVAIPLRTGDAVLTDDLPKLPLIGSGSTRSGLTSSRELGVTYTNSKPYSIFVTVMLQSTARDSNLITRMRISDTPASNYYIGTRGNDADILAEATHSQLVLPGERYVVTSSPNSKIVSWVEIAQ